MLEALVMGRGDRRAAWMVLLALAVLPAVACAAGETAERPPTEAWRADAVWDDGNAEFCAYEVSWSRYQNLYPGRALLILVKEPWAPDLDVKADRPRADGFDVLKLNHVRDVPTGIYTYNQMASVFLRRDTGVLRKMSVTSSEGCGISTAHVTDGVLNTRSYFDGQGEATRPYPAAARAEDGLAATLRDLVDGELPKKLEVVPSFMTGYLPDPAPVSYRVTRREDEVEVPAGRLEVVEIRLEGEGRWLSYAFDRRPPHPLVLHRASDGTEYRQARCERIPYWSLNRPGGEDWLPEALR